MSDELSPAQRSHNRKLMLVLAKAKVPVFVSSGKTPLVQAYNKLDTEITSEQREQIIADYAAKHDGREPKFIGATTNEATVRAMLNAHPDAVPSIATGPAGLIALDADKKNNGPEQLDAFFEENGGKPGAAVQIPTKSGGYHLYFVNDGKLGNKAGALKRLGADVRGTGGQCVAPGAWLPSGRYGTMEKDTAAFLRAYVHGTLPPLPDYVVDAIGKAAPDQKPDEASDDKTKMAINALLEAEWPTFEDIFDGDLAKYDLEALAAKDSAFAALYEHPDGDCSTNRFKIARALMSEYPDMPIEDLAVFFENYDGAGEFIDDGRPGEGQYDYRQVAREWLKNQGLKKVTDGSAFGAVDDDTAVDDTPYKAKLKETTGLPVVFANQIIDAYQHMRWRVKHLLPHIGVGALYGLPNSGKSFLALDGSIKIRVGEQWFGRKTIPANVLYCYGEGVEGIGGRIKAAYDSRGEDTPDKHIAVLKQVPNFFLDAKAGKKLIKTARDIEQLTGEPVGMIVLDTLAIAAAGADENSVEDMSLVFDRLRKVANELECVILIVHHADKQGKTMRGSSAVNGTADFVLRVEEGKAPNAASTIYAEKMRDAPKGFTVKFKLKVVEIGKDSDDDAVTSCVIVDLTEPGSTIDLAADDPSTHDELEGATAEAEQAANRKRLAKIISLIGTHGAPHKDGGRFAPLQVLAMHYAELAKFRTEHLKNLGRDFMRSWLEGDPAVRLPTGWLRLTKSKDGLGLRFEPETDT